MGKNRSILVQKNLIYALLFYISSNLLKFIVRFFFVKSLPVEFLGVNGLLSNVLALLSFAELGIGQAIVFSLYKPIADDNKKTIIAIMSLYKKLYNIVGFLIIVCGLAITPCLDWFIKDSQIEELNIYYIIFVINMGVSYFFAYKRDLIIAYQKQYINNEYKMIFQVILSVLQIIALILFESYFVYLFLMLVITVIENYCVGRKAEKLFPFLQKCNANNIVLYEIKQGIIKNIKALIMHRIGTIFVTASPNLIISKFIGLKAVALYSNYFMVLFAVNNFAVNMFGAITANIGNLLIEEGKKEKIKIFKLVQFVIGLQSAVICSGFYVLLNPLIKLWLGQDFLFDNNIVTLLIINFYLNYMRRGVLVFREASGLYWQDRFKPIAEGLIFVVSAVVLQSKTGMIGIPMGLILSTIFTSFWVEPYVLFNNGIDIKLKDYFIDYFKFTVVALLAAVLSKVLYSNLFDKVTLLNFIAGMVLCVVITLSLWFAVFKNRQECRYLLNKLMLKMAKK
ncbi:MAG: transporter [Phascolarctobacterium sp.]|nr:MAG: transporter [Phascolarctobacterium sp.]